MVDYPVLNQDGTPVLKPDGTPATVSGPEGTQQDVINNFYADEQRAKQAAQQQEPNILQQGGEAIKQATEGVGETTGEAVVDSVGRGFGNIANVGYAVKDLIQGQEVDPENEDIPVAGPEHFPGVGGFDERMSMLAGTLIAESAPKRKRRLKRLFGKRLINRTKDKKSGQEIWEVLDSNGEIKRIFPEKSGFDQGDARDILGMVLPFAVTGGIAGGATSGAGALVRAGLQAPVAGATQALLDTTLGEGFDRNKMFLAMAGGAASEFLAPVLAKIPGLGKLFSGKRLDAVVDKNGNFTKGILREMEKEGIDPSQMSDEVKEIFTKQLRAGAPVAETARSASAKRFNLDTTAAERSRKIEDFRVESDLESTRFGPDNEARFKNFMAGRAEQIPEAQRQLQRELFPGTSTGAGRDVGLATQIRTGAKTAEKAAREAAGAKFRPNAKLRQFEPDNANRLLIQDNIGLRMQGTVFEQAPKTTTAMKMVDDWIAGRPGVALPKSEAGAKIKPIKTFDQLARAVRKMERAAFKAGDPDDYIPMSNLRKSMDDYEDVMTAKGLIDPKDNANSKLGRKMWRSYKDRFVGQDDAGKLIQKLIKKNDSANSTFSTLFGGKGTNTKKAGSGVVTALKRLKNEILDPADWSAVKQSFMHDMTTTSGSPRTGLSGFKYMDDTINNNREMYNVLYSPQEQKVISDYMDALKVVHRIQINPSGSAIQLSERGLSQAARKARLADQNFVFRRMGRMLSQIDILQGNRVRGLTARVLTDQIPADLMKNRAGSVLLNQAKTQDLSRPIDTLAGRGGFGAVLAREQFQNRQPEE